MSGIGINNYLNLFLAFRHIQRLHKNGGPISNIGDQVLLRASGITAYQKISTTTSTTTTTPSTATTTRNTTTASSSITTTSRSTAISSTASTVIPINDNIRVGDTGSTEGTKNPETGDKGGISHVNLNSFQRIQ